MILRRYARSLALALALMPLILGAVACKEDTPTPRPLRVEQKPATVIALPSSTPRPTDTPEATATSANQSGSAIDTGDAFGLPADGDVPIIQFARIEPSPWEPEILADMHPNFSLRADGYMVYRFQSGNSVDGWYQTVLTPTLGLEFLRILVEDIDVPMLARELPQETLSFETAPDGTAAGSGPVGVIYVNTSAGDARLIISQDMLENPTGPHADRIKRLQDCILALQLWRNAPLVEATGSEEDLIRLEEQKVAVESFIGWWVDRREPYSPAGLAVYGTKARSYYRSNVEVFDWPLPEPLSDQVEAEFGSTPTELNYDYEDGLRIWRANSKRNDDFWGPLWKDSAGDRYIVGIRPAIPGGNQAIVDYEYTMPRRNLRPNE